MKKKIVEYPGLAIVHKSDPDEVAEGLTGVKISTDPFEVMENYRQNKKMYPNTTLRMCTIVFKDKKRRKKK
jgi:hypothetical protein